MNNMGSKKTIGMIGMGGSGMRGLAYLLSKKGHRVIGTDDQHESLETEFKNEPYTLMTEQDFKVAMKECEEIIYTDAINKDNALLADGEKYGLTVVGYSQALSNFSRDYTTIAVAGTHGKSTTTAMISQMLIEQEFDPTVVIGAGVPEWNGRHARLGMSKYMVVEADEYLDHFLTLRPKYIVITSIEHDHPDYFPELEDVVKSFEAFLRGLKPGGKVVALKSVVSQYKKLQWSASTVVVDDELVKDIYVGVPGKHMRLNALLGINLVIQIGGSKELALNTIRNFHGIRRRFEELGKYEDLLIVSDYGHHPTEIRETFKAAQEKYVNKKLLVLFEGHTVDRLERYRDQFVEVLCETGGPVVLAPAYLPKGRGSETVVAQKALDYIEREVSKRGIEVLRMKDYRQLGVILRKKSDQYDVGIGFSAGALDGELRKIVQTK